jgi:exosortase C (VPDSG-CTERM-specific)
MAGADVTLTPEENATRWPRRVLWLAASVLILLALFKTDLHSLWTLTQSSELSSYIVLVPFIVGYLLYTQGPTLPRRYSSSVFGAAAPFLVGAIILALLWTRVIDPRLLSENDHLSLVTLALVCFLWTVGFLFLGSSWMGSAAFPVIFLIFLVPLPDAMVEGLERSLQLASAQAAGAFFALSGTPALRTGTLFELPGIALQVAKECSGIRSSWVLFITSLIAAFLLLRRPWSRILLVGAVIPLGILRNGFRILVIGLLCVNVDPHMIDSPIHRRGGPIFFVASLVPLGLLLWILRRRESAATQASKLLRGNDGVTSR